MTFENKESLDKSLYATSRLRAFSVSFFGKQLMELKGCQMAN
jgi:hypothetical protein